MVVQSLKCMASIPNGDGADVPIDAQDPTLPFKSVTMKPPTSSSAAGGTQSEEEPSSTPGRRTSARIQVKQRELLVRRRVELLNDREQGATKKRTPSSSSSSSNAKSSAPKEPGEQTLNGVSDTHDQPMNLGLKQSDENGLTPLSLAGKSDHAKVKETLRLFNKHYLHFVQVSQ